MDYLLWFIAGVLFLIGISAVSSIAIGRICPIPSGNNVIKTIIMMIKKYDDGNGEIGDIGSGYGYLLFRLASAFPQRKIIGYEISVVPYVISSLIRVVFRYKNVEIVFGDAFKNIKKRPSRLSSAVAYLPALRAINDSLETVLKDSVSGVLVINTYKLTNPQPIEESDKLDVFKSKVYVYKSE